MSIGDFPEQFRQGQYGGGDYMMVCVDYRYSSMVLDYACDNDSYGGQRGHIAAYAGEFCGPRLDGTWAWTDGGTCRFRGEE